MSPVFYLTNINHVAPSQVVIGTVLLVVTAPSSVTASNIELE